MPDEQGNRPDVCKWPGCGPEGNRRLTDLERPVYPYDMGPVMRILTFCLVASAWALTGSHDGRAEQPPMTRDVPIPEFQNPDTFVPFYDFDAAPKGLFRSIQFTEGFEEELGYRRTHEIVLVSPTEIFHPDSPTVYLVFSVFPHYESFQVQGVCFPENVEGLDPKTPVAKDSMYLALEDETGYLKLLPPTEGWKPGTYKVEIHIGWQVNQISLIGTMRFTVAQSPLNATPLN